MKMILQSHSSYSTLAEFDPMGPTIATFDRAAAPTWVTEAVCGWFADLGEHLVALYWEADALYVQAGTHNVLLKVHTVTVQTEGVKRVLRILFEGRVVLELTYPIPTIDPPLYLDLTPFVEEEDYDFGLFIAHIAQDPERQERIFHTNR